MAALKHLLEVSKPDAGPVEDPYYPLSAWEKMKFWSTILLGQLLLAFLIYLLV